MKKSELKKLIREEIQALNESKIIKEDNDYSEYYDMKKDKYNGETVYILRHWSNPGRSGHYSAIDLGNKESAKKIIDIIKKAL